jgi:hypothetical protein
MRALALFAALTLVIAPVLVAPTAAYADGLERPRQRPRPAPRRPTPPPPGPPVIIEEGPETVTLPDSFFVDGGGVGADIGRESYYWGGPVVIRGRSHGREFAFAPRPRGPRR